MKQPPFVMEAGRREPVLAALHERCRQQHWVLLASHVRTNQVHILVEAEMKPETVMNDIKSYASRCLNLTNWDEPARKRWARHSAAIRFVVDKQGEPMAVFER